MSQVTIMSMDLNYLKPFKDFHQRYSNSSYLLQIFKFFHWKLYKQTIIYTEKNHTNQFNHIKLIKILYTIKKTKNPIYKQF